MSDEPHRAAILALLDAGLTQPVYDGQVPNGATRPYVLVYISISTPAESALDGLSDIKIVEIYTHSVGDTPAAAALVNAAVETVLLNQRLILAGRSCGPIRQDVALSPNRDESTGTLVMDAVANYSFTSLPA